MGTAYNTNIVTDGLIGCWDAANKRSYPGAGTTWTDLVNGNNGTLENMTAGDDEGGFNSRNGGVIEFDGTDTYIDLGSITSSNPLMCAGGPVSMCVWLYDIDGVGGDHTYPYIIQKGLGDGENGYGLIADGTGSIQVISDEAWCQTAGGIFSQDKWQFISGTIDTSGNMRAYVNGVYYPNSQRNVTAVVPDTTAQMDFGKWNKFGGYLGPVYIYNTLLTDAEILQNYEATKPRFAPRITKSNLELNFDAGDPQSYSGGTTWKDTASGISAVLQNMEADDFNSSNGGYLEFDGTDEFAIVAQSGGWSMQGWAALTMETWINVAGNRWHRILYENQNQASTYGYRVATDLYNANSAFWLHAGSSVAVQQSIVSLDTWFQYVCRWDGTTMNVYKNGVKVGGSGTSNSGTIQSSSGSKGGVAIAAGWNSVNGLQSASETLYGKMGLLRVYQGALSDAEILDNYQKTKGRFGH